MDDLISRQAAIDVCNKAIDLWQGQLGEGIVIAVRKKIEELPSAQPREDTISRQAAIEAVSNMLRRKFGIGGDLAEITLAELPSAQPERTCVNCGRTANNGGWYADGGTRCPIEEHYALPKDGYCHLWEKRSVTDDDYPERRTDE